MERVPRKKGRAPVKKVWLVGLMLLAAALCAIAAYFVSRPATDAAPQAAEHIYLLDRPADEILSIAVAPAGKTAYPLVRGEDGSLRLMGQEDVPLRQSVLDEYLLAAAQVEAVEVIADTAKESVALSDYGLEPPALRVVVGYTDGGKKELLLGGRIYDEERNAAYYCMLGGDSRIYGVLAAPCDIFFHDQNYLRDFDQPKLDGELMNRVSVKGQDTLAMVYTPVGWQMEAPVRYPVLAEKMDALLQRISQMGFEAYLGPVRALDVSLYGLDTPTHVITLTQAPTTVSGVTENGEQVSYDLPAVTYTLSLGASEGDSALYVQWMDGVYKASNFLMGFWKELSAEEFYLRRPVNFPVNQLTRLTVEANGEKRVYDLSMVESIGPDNQVETDEYGETLYDVEIRRDGKLLDSRAFLSWYTDLAALSPLGRLNGKETAGDMLLCLTLESGTLKRTVTLYAYDALHCVLDVDGTRLFYTDREYLKKLNACP